MVLSRHIHESIIIDGRIKVTIVDIRDGKVRLGITAPNDVPVNREEVQDIIDNGYRSADPAPATHPLRREKRRGNGEGTGR